MKTRDTKNYDTVAEVEMDREPLSSFGKTFEGYPFCPMHGAFPEDKICAGAKCNGNTVRCTLDFSGSTKS